MISVLCIDADWDVVTKYGRAFRDKFVFTNSDKDFLDLDIKHLRGSNAIQPGVDKYLKTNPIQYISGMGHGLYDTFTGFHDKPIWSASQDLSLLKGVIVHLLSCQTGASLGREMVAQGALAFWGYTVSFSFFRQDPPPSDMDTDNVAAPFLKMDCLIDRGILGRKTASQIYNAIEEYVADLYPQLEFHQQAILLDNYLHLVCPVTVWGDPNAMLR
jgi:hypothetical protein